MMVKCVGGKSDRAGLTTSFLGVGEFGQDTLRLNTEFARDQFAAGGIWGAVRVVQTLGHEVLHSQGYGHIAVRLEDRGRENMWCGDGVDYGNSWITIAQSCLSWVARESEAARCGAAAVAPFCPGMFLESCQDSAGMMLIAGYPTPDPGWDDPDQPWGGSPPEPDPALNAADCARFGGDNGFDCAHDGRGFCRCDCGRHPNCVDRAPGECEWVSDPRERTVAVIEGRRGGPGLPDNGLRSTNYPPIVPPDDCSDLEQWVFEDDWNFGAAADFRPERWHDPTWPLRDEFVVQTGGAIGVLGVAMERLSWDVSAEPEPGRPVSFLVQAVGEPFGGSGGVYDGDEVVLGAGAWAPGALPPGEDYGDWVALQLGDDSLQIVAATTGADSFDRLAVSPGNRTRIENACRPSTTWTFGPGMRVLGVGDFDGFPGDELFVAHENSRGPEFSQFWVVRPEADAWVQIAHASVTEWVPRMATIEEIPLGAELVAVLQTAGRPTLLLKSDDALTLVEVDLGEWDPADPTKCQPGTLRVLWQQDFPIRVGSSALRNDQMTIGEYSLGGGADTIVAASDRVGPVLVFAFERSVVTGAWGIRFDSALVAGGVLSLPFGPWHAYTSVELPDEVELLSALSPDGGEDLVILRVHARDGVFPPNAYSTFDDHSHAERQTARAALVMARFDRGRRAWLGEGMRLLACQTGAGIEESCHGQLLGQWLPRVDDHAFQTLRVENTREAWIVGDNQ